MNKHPSCNQTWLVTTRASLHLSEAMTFLMQGNVHLEAVLLAEFEGKKSADSMNKMLLMVRKSRESLAQFRDDLFESIQIGKKTGNPYVGDFLSMDEDLLARKWDQTMLFECQESVRRLGAEAKRDNLASAKRFFNETSIFLNTANQVIEVFEQALSYAKEGKLKWAIEEGKFPLQRVFATHFSRILVFMREYLVDSLIATEVVFKAKGTTLLVS